MSIATVPPSLAQPLAGVILTPSQIWQARVAAQTAWGEARGEGTLGMHAVLNSIWNRVLQPGWWGKDAASVCLFHDTKGVYQYDCWDPRDPNSKALAKIADSDPQFRIALPLAAQMLLGRLEDITHASDSYYRLGTPVPFWATGTRYRCTVNNQAFYRVGVAGNG